MKPKLLFGGVVIFLGIATYLVVKAVFGVTPLGFSMPSPSQTSFSAGRTGSIINPTFPGTAVSPQKTIPPEGNMGMGGIGDVYYPNPTRPIYPIYPEPSDTSLYNPNRVYLKSSTFSFVVNDTSKYISDITNYFLTIGGRILSSQINTANKYTYAYLLVKIPVTKFDEANMKVKDGVKKIIAANTNSQDDTARMDSSTSQLDRLKTDELNKQKEIADEKDKIRLAQLRLELKYIQEQIKAAENQVQTVTAQTDFATISLTVADSPRYFNSADSDQPDLRETWDNSLESLKNTLVVIASFAIQVAVFSILWLPLVIVAKVIYSRLNSHN